jgi:RimK family alpha-L-glutamate ligase
MLHSPDLHPRGRRDAPLRAVLFTVARDWHARALAAAFSRRNIVVTTMPLERCAFDAASPSGLRLGDLPGLPDGAFVRTLSAGSFEAVTRRLGLLHALSALGMPVWNEAVAIERCVDKSMTTFLLGRAGLPVPPTWAVEGIDAAREIVAREAAAGPLVLKPLFGSQGRGLMLVREPAELPPADAVADVYYLQRFVGGGGPTYSDFRVFVIEGMPVAAMARHGASWITNVKQGGRPLPIVLDRELADLATAAAVTVGARFCGVDILRGPDGSPFVLEVNSMPAWSGLQTVATIDIAEVLAERFSASLRAPASRQVA